jgi:PAS domain S-box-containing protein
VLSLQKNFYKQANTAGYNLSNRNRQKKLIDKDRMMSQGHKSSAEMLNLQGATFQQIFEVLPDAVVVTDAAGKIQFANRQAEKMFGYQLEELIGQPVEILIPARFADHSKHRETYLAHPRQRPIGSGLELVARRKEGLEFPVDIALSPLETAGGLAVIVTIRDITPWNLAVQDLKRSEAHNRALLAAIPDLMIRVYRNGTVWDYHMENPEDYFISPASLLGKNLSETFPQNMAEQALDAIERVVETGKRQSFTYSLPLASETQHFEAWVAPSNPDDFIVIMRDITEQYRMEQALRESEQRFRHLFTNSPDAIMLIDPHDPQISWPIVDCNQAACHMNGYSREEMIGQSIDLLNVTPGTRKERDLYMKNLRREHVILSESLHRHKDGHIFPIEISTSLFTLGGRELVVGIDRDITARKQAEEAMRESDERFRDLFENSPVSLWEEDFSQVKYYLENLKDVDPEERETYLREHPEVVSECAALVKILDVNRASMKLYETNDKTALLENIANVLTLESLNALRQEFLAIWNGERRLEVDGKARTLSGLQRDVSIIWEVAPGYEDSYARVLVSLIDITERRQAAEEIRTRTEELSTLFELSRALAKMNDVADVLELVNRRAVAGIHITFSRIALLEEGELTIRSAYPIRVLEHDLFVGSRNTLKAMPYCKAILDQDEPFLLRGGDTLLNAQERAALLLDFAKTVCLVPLQVYDPDSNTLRSLGLLMLGEARQEEREPFTPNKMRLARSIGDMAAIAIDNTRLVSDLHRSNSELMFAYDATIAGWSAALDLRDKETEGHTQRVTEMTVRLAERMGFSQQDLVHVRRGALLHDIGKMGVPDSILLKPDKLTDEEWVVMRMHPVYAYEFLKPIPYLGPALDIPYCHHEKWDGTGYPRGLKGEDIPLSARIFASVDIYDALKSDRPYRAAWTKEKTLEHIQSLRGSHLDPQVVDTFQAFIRETQT